MCKISVIVMNASSQVMECDFLLEPCCALILLYAYPTTYVVLSTVLCLKLTLLCLNFFFSRALLPCCALIFFRAHLIWCYPAFRLPCCALNFFFRALTLCLTSTSILV